MKIEGNTFLVTGGSSGLGAACARHLVSGGANVVLADVDVERGVRLAGELGSTARFVETDVTDAESVSGALAVATEAFGSLEGAINCAGMIGAGRVVGREGPYDLDAFSRVIQVNLIGTFNVVRLAAALMSDGATHEDDERGVIVNTASVAAFDGQIGQAAYSATKAATDIRCVT